MNDKKKKIVISLQLNTNSDHPQKYIKTNNKFKRMEIRRYVNTYNIQ